MVGCFCSMVKAAVSNNFDHIEDVYTLQPCFLFFLLDGDFYFFFRNPHYL